MGRSAGIDTRLRKLRNEKEWTLAEAAEGQPFSVRSLSNYETPPGVGNHRFPGMLAIIALCKRYRVSADHLLGLRQGR